MLHKLNTRRLLAYKNSLTKDPYMKYEPEEMDSEEYTEWYNQLEEVKAILATREHIPRKGKPSGKK